MVDVRYLGSGDIIQDLKNFEARARVYDKDYNSFINEIRLDMMLKRIDHLSNELNKRWNDNLTKPITPTKNSIFKKISPLANPRDPILCALCLHLNKNVYIKSKKGYKSHLNKQHKNQQKPDMNLIEDDIEVHCMLTKDNGKRCTKSFDVDQIYR